MLHVVGIKNCNKIRDTKKWLEEKEVEFEFIDVKKDPLTEEELAELTHKVGLDTLINRRGRTWRNLNLADKELNDEDLFKALLENQTMIRRPVLIKDDAVFVGYDEEAMESFIAEYQ